MKYRLLALSLVFLLGSNAHAEDLFVDQDDPLCSDTTGTPFCQVAAAVANAVDGDRVLVGAGTYQESLSIFRDITVRGEGMGVTVIDGGNFVTFTLSGDVTLEAMTITGAANRGVRSSANSSLVDCEITGNSGPGGGGIYQTGGELELVRTVVSNNTSNAPNIAGGAGIWTDSGDLTVIDSQIVENHNLHPGSPGGGLKLNGGDVMITGTTIALNTSQNNAGGISSIGDSLTLIDSAVYDNTAFGSPGGIGVLGSDLSLTNTTVSGNQAQFTAGISVGICCGTFTMRNVTVFDNHSTSASSPGGIFAGTEAVVSNSIIAGNTNSLGGADCSGDLVSEGYNLIEDSSCAITGDSTGNILGVPAGLLPLADHGGLTWTHAPESTSPIRDAGNPASVGSAPSACPETDQRGVSRPQDSDGDGTARCDIGAHEAIDALFSDGFESGDTSRWSQSMP